MRRAVQSVMDSHKKKLTWKEAFFELMKVEPSSFSGRDGWTDLQGNHIEAREVGYSATGNVGIVMIGLLYGEGDFEKSITIAMNCGEDTDCTVATVGAIFGILYGEDSIPEKWIKPIDLLRQCNGLDNHSAQEHRRFNRQNYSPCSVDSGKPVLRYSAGARISDYRKRSPALSEISQTS